jgi:uncharacterized Fe-S cluster protein YjdI
MPKSTFRYTNDEVTVVWKPETCIHSRICWTNLLSVFNPTKRPWVNMQGANTDTIIDQVKKCPSGALSYFMNADAEGDQREGISGAAGEITEIEIQPNGPIIITTDCHIKHSSGQEEVRKGRTALCRCGASSNKPYCDGTHNKIGFKG